MISREDIQNILETSRIEEVVGDYVTLKKRGVNLIGLCPFHNEKTPSFTVSPSKGIYKCFGCGKAGNSVNFLMEHEHYTYPEALRHLARKYFIDIEEVQESAEEIIAQSEKESLFSVSAFAQKYFSECLVNTDEGKAIGLTYFKHREFTEAIIEKFQLGYCLEEWEEFTKAAIENGFKKEYLVTTGLSILKDEKLYDRFRGRVMFPIHNVSGRVIGFGGRILSADKTKAKYVNSPESEIYHKSNVLYGIYFAKNSIISQDNCFLVEGYTDVISMHMAGIENVVASSGTSLTTEQIKLIRRYTPNITILYDGDAAGIKASFRGIDMILEEGMNVKIVLFPDGEDPDSYARKHRPAEVRDFINQTATDFIKFKTDLLVKETANDPIKKANLIKEIVGSVSLIPDAIVRSVYTRECSSLMKVPEQTLINEMNKLRRKKVMKKAEEIAEEQELPENTEYTAEQQIVVDDTNTEYQEKALMCFMLNNGKKTITIKERIETETTSDSGKTEIIVEEVNSDIPLAQFIILDLQRDHIDFQNPVFQTIMNEYSKMVEENNIPDAQYFINHEKTEISSSAIELLFNPHNLSENWIKHRISVKTEEQDLYASAISYIYSLKLKKVDKMISENLDEIKNSTNEEDQILLMQKHYRLMRSKKEFADKLTRIVTK
ncbi:MAG TPA: DNA primase [Bacteroidales bacterium]|nr:DNA primase [Bacteroidales bacterium]HPS16662.1 DNA primase [Bacteroidales bacterium]